ncbi:substrate-binding periplasmic protein [Cognaticolwellia mytili]|uniref:substrate-binding periplasmic protein n=1 Tax=Cognaticolwellia mytili TaxID=1888913 RepID=UPI00118092BD|nr:ABC transporter substrate-binding protein [Cognaticolwellia mytili]
MKTVLFSTFRFLFLALLAPSVSATSISEELTESSQKMGSANHALHSIDMVAGLPKPPFIIEENGAGLQLDLIREAFISVNHQVNYTHLPLGRNISGFKRFNAEGIAILPSDYQHPSIFLSKPYITYQNVAVSLTDDDLSIKTIAELSGKSVIAFQNAKKFLGDEYNTSISLSTDYREIADQMQQIEMLFSRRTEVIILDVSIFKFFVKSHVGGRYSQGYTIHPIFAERGYAAGFNTKQHRDMFDHGITLIKEQGVYQLVLDRYLQ